MNPFTKIWFWVLILSLIAFIISIVLFESMSETTSQMWIWAIFAISIILFIMAFILYIISVTTCYTSVEKNRMYAHDGKECSDIMTKPESQCQERVVIEKKYIKEIPGIVHVNSGQRIQNTEPQGLKILADISSPTPIMRG